MRQPDPTAGWTQGELGDGTLVPFADSLWTATTPIRFAMTWFPHVMTVVRLTDGRVLLHSPGKPSDHLRREIARIGRVSDVVAPNWFHDLYLREYRDFYPDAAFWGPAFLQRRQRSIINCALDVTTRPPWYAELPYVSLSGLLSFDESAFFHVATRTLIVADLLMNASVGNDAPIVTRLGYRLFGLDGRLRVFPILQWFGVSSRASLGATAQQIFAWNPERLVVGHGRPLEEHVTVKLSAALRWLTTDGEHR
jgi:Domain of unknown function (DUF4336)